MSFSAYARPLPTERPPAESFYAIKWAMKEALDYGHDGSCREGPFTLGKEYIPFLKGVMAGGNTEMKEDAKRLLKLIKDNPQGVVFWIGDEDDF